MKFIFIFYVSFGVLISKNAFGEVFTGITHMFPLLKTQEFLITGMRNYITETQFILDMLRSYLELVKEEYREAKKGINEYLSNPLNAYLLTKRLTSEWQEVEELMTNDIGNKTIENVNHHRTKNLLLFPTEDDLNGAAIAILRLQSVYNLKTSSLAKGEIKESRLSKELSSNDCFEIGRQCYLKGHYHCTRDWMKEAMHRYYDEEGDIEMAFGLTKRLLEIAPSDKRVRDNYVYYKRAIKEQKIILENRNKSYEIVNIREAEYNDRDRNKIKYEKLCRNELTISEKIRANLKCRYVDFGRPFLKLARVKEEEAYLDPRIVIYHDVISDEEIRAVQKLSIPKFQPAYIIHRNLSKDLIYKTRVSEVAWIRDFEDHKIAAVSRRIQEITGLDLESSEPMQVINYGVGGHYEPHFDFPLEPRYFGYYGNRLATFLFYMSDVPHGGATVFPLIKVAVRPKKGSAVFWYNLKRSGDFDFLSLHASCPVVIGSKWICNKWLHEYGQEFRHPCELTED